MNPSVGQHFFIIACLLLAITAAHADEALFKSGDLIIETKEKSLRYKIDVADNEHSRSRGLMHRHTLPSDQGMLLLYKTPRRVNIWMRNTFVPLDIIYINDKGDIVKIIENAEPQSTRLMPSEGEVKAVLELKAGQVRAQRIAVGDPIRYQLH